MKSKFMRPYEHNDIIYRA